MDPRTSYKLPIHKHPLFPSVRLFDKCGACRLSTDAIFDKGYACKVCNNVCFHKDCAEAPLKINHPSHPKHSLLLLNDMSDYKIHEYLRSACALCGVCLYLAPLYGCVTCKVYNIGSKFTIDFACVLKPSPRMIEKPLCHDHPLLFLKERFIYDGRKFHCEVCKNLINGPSYKCGEYCYVYFHVDCINFSKEVNHPHHSNHPLKLVSSNTLSEDIEKRFAISIAHATPQLSLTCSVCCETIDEKHKVIYYCSICDFIACLVCTKSPPPLTIEHFKTHKHPLAIFSRRITYICDICGMEENTGRPYFCLQCDFVIHLQCINLPRVININRHVHRVYFTHRLGVGYLKCGICREKMCKYRGAYACSICPNYAVHSQCATGRYVWDNVELDGTPDDTEDIAPFKVVGDNLINHFSHKEHHLKLYNDNYIFNDDKGIQCEACSYPLGFGSFYTCEECCFALHEKCANLPMKKRFVFSTALYTLEVNRRGFVDCKRCKMLHDGFKYTSGQGDDVDVHCGSLSEPLVHDCHVHPLYFEAKRSNYYCSACKNDDAKDYGLRCDLCKFDLCFYCANLPLKIRNMSHEHPLTLCYGEMAFGITWCERCEKELDPSKWFYVCFECGVTLHDRCVIEDFSCLKLEKTNIHVQWMTLKVALNNHITRPLCRWCRSRCTRVNIIYDDNHDWVQPYNGGFKSAGKPEFNCGTVQVLQGL